MKISVELEVRCNDCFMIVEAVVKQDIDDLDYLSVSPCDECEAKRMDSILKAATKLIKGEIK